MKSWDRFIEFRQKNRQLSIEINARIKNLPTKKRIRVIAIILLRGLLFGLGLGIILLIPIFVVILLSITYGFKLPDKLVINIYLLLAILIFIIIGIRLLSPEKTMKIVENIEKQ